ncbi:MAG: monofunctional biosynthetic peptidoglycan transglycosylase [Gammaproteobacteria bacterium]|nr:monofunctional biosynthetic peptidoglycan transglycosylase [Gammaproteobacteria bacterium]
MMLAILALRFMPPPTTAFMLRADHARYAFVPIEQIADSLQLAIIAAEDQRFYQHHGIDWHALKSAMDGGAERGASTLTQQLCKNLFLWGGRSYLRKLIEADCAISAEWLLPKRRILELYINVAQFSAVDFGAEAAARSIFGVSASRLSLEQSATLAAALPAPAQFDAASPGPHLQRRTQWVLRQMRQLGPDWLQK